MSNRLRGRLFDELRRGDQDDDVSVMVIRGGRRVLLGRLRPEPRPRSAVAAADRVRDGFWSRSLVEGWFEMMDMSTPIIAQVHGYCLAGGSELAAACDLLYVTPDATIGYPAIRTMSSPDLLWQPWFMGMRRAMEALLTGDSMTGAEAVESGFANRAFRRATRGRSARVAERVAQIPGDLLALEQADRAPCDGGRGHARPACARPRTLASARPAPAVVEGVHAEAAVGGREAGGSGSRRTLRRRAGQAMSAADPTGALAAAAGAARPGPGQLEELVRIPSISADPDHRDDVRASAEATAEPP